MESKVVSQTCLFRASSPEELVRVQLLFSVGAAPGSFSWVTVVGRGWHGVCLEISRISKFTCHGPLPLVRSSLPQFGFQHIWALSCHCHEVETRSSHCGPKGPCAVCKTIGRDERVLGGTPQASSPTQPPEVQRKASYPVGAGRGLARQLAVPVFRPFSVAPLLSPQSCADQLRCL